MLKVEELKSVQQSRKSVLNVGNKTIPMPCFFTYLRNPSELDYVCEWVEDCHSDNFQGIVLPLNKAKKIKSSKESRLGIKSLSGNEVERGYSSIKSSKLIFIDSKILENAYYRRNGKVIGIDLPDILSNIISLPPPIERTKKLNHYQNVIDELSNITTPDILKFFKILKILDADVLLPPTPLIVPEIPSSLRLSFKINKMAQEVCKTRDGWDTAYFFLLKTSVFENLDTLEEIYSFIDREKPKIVVFKITDPETLDNRNSFIQREHLKMFLKKMRFLSKTFEVAVFWFNLDILGLFFAVSGSDGFCTPIDGYLSPRFAPLVSRPEHLKGRYFLYDKMAFIPFSVLVKIYESNRRVLPCNADCCKKYNGKDISRLGRLEKSRFTRRHYLGSINKLMRELHESLNQEDIDGFFDKLANGECKNYVSILPNH